MSNKEQQRPTQTEFEAAALRLAQNNYPDWWESALTAQIIVRFGSLFTMRPAPERRISLEKSDRKVISSEQMFEGYLIGEESLATFAKNQLARYRSLEKH